MGRITRKKAELTNIDIALYALYNLGGGEQAIHTEDIALSCWHLVSERFSWKKYPKYPEIDPARVALSDAAKAKYGKLTRLVMRKIAEKPQAHWILTDAGVEYVRSRYAELARLETVKIQPSSGHTEKDRFIVALKRHPTFKKFASTGTCEGIEPYEFTDLLKCSLDASPKALRERLETLKSRSAEAEDAALARFLRGCEERFRSMLEE